MGEIRDSVGEGGVFKVAGSTGGSMCQVLTLLLQLQSKTEVKAFPQSVLKQLETEFYNAVIVCHGSMQTEKDVRADLKKKKTD